MRHSDSNNSDFGGGDMPCSDNDGGSSIEPKNIEERGNPWLMMMVGGLVQKPNNKPVGQRPVLVLEIII
jgi:hypothetical protein